MNPHIATLRRAGVVHPNRYHGTGRSAKRGPDQIKPLVESLRKQGLREGQDYETGNDSPRYGWTGWFVKLTPAGTKKITSP